MKRALKKPVKSFDMATAYFTAYGGEICLGGSCGFNW